MGNLFVIVLVKDTSNDQQYDFIPRDEEGRSILMEVGFFGFHRGTVRFLFG